MRRIAAALLLLCAVLPATAAAAEVEEDQVLAAARSVSLEYQNHLRLLADGLSATSEEAHIDAMRALAGLRDPAVVPLIMPFLESGGHSNAEMIMACTTLGSLGYQTAVPAIRQLCAHADAGVRQAATLALQQIGVVAAGDWMARAKENDEALHLAATVNLGQLKHPEAAEMLVKGLDHSKALVRIAACVGIGRLGDRALGEKLRPALTDANPAVRRYAGEALAVLGYTPAIPDLLMALEANVAGSYLNQALRALSSQDFGFDPQAPLLQRQQAIERGFAWWVQHPDLKK